MQTVLHLDDQFQRSYFSLHFKLESSVFGGFVRLGVLLHTRRTRRGRRLAITLISDVIKLLIFKSGYKLFGFRILKTRVSYTRKTLSSLTKGQWYLLTSPQSWILLSMS